MFVRRWLPVLLILLAAPAALPAAEKSATPGKFFFKDGDTIILMGDSITEQHLYSNYIEMWTVCRFPAWKLTFRNVGIGGDRSIGGNSRFQRDVVRYKATAMTVDFGMNDGGYRPFDEGLFSAYMKGLQGIADQARAAGVRVAWVTPQPVEHDPANNKAEFYNQTLEKFSAGVKQIADRNHGLFVDQFHPYWAVVKNARAAGETRRITSGDAVHPGPPGQAVMAASILKGLGFPQQISRVEITLKESGLPEVRATGCKVSELGGKQPDGKAAAQVSFLRQDRALPFFPPGAEGILKWAPLRDEMNRLELQVKGLARGTYAVRLGGQEVATFSADQLARGINLAEGALKAGPVAKQVGKVWQTVVDKNRYFHDQVYRGVVLNGKLSKDQQESLFSQRMERMPALDAAVREALVMHPYRVEVVRSGE